MGLTVAVGLLARNINYGDDQERELLLEPFRELNAVLAEQGLPLHNEPENMAHADYFEAEMWGYGGLHALRRIAAHIALNGTLPPSSGEYEDFANDPTLTLFCQRHEAHLHSANNRGLRRLFVRKKRPEAFAHLINHSDAEGFYIPGAFDDVIVDWTEPQRPGLGMMIGSVVSLEAECEVLAAALAVPDGLDGESDDLLEFIESPRSTGTPWQTHAIATHSLLNLRRACFASLATGAAIQFC